MKHPLSQFVYCPKCGGKFVENNESSNKCLNCGFIYYFNPRAAVVAVITNESGDILVCRRAKDPAKGTLDLPGGFTDVCETAEEAVVREVREETGLDVISAEYLFSLPNTYNYSDFEVHTMDLFFKCHVKSFEHIEALDDVAASFFVPKKEIDPSQFGLQSVKLGVKYLLSDYRPGMNCDR